MLIEQWLDEHPEALTLGDKLNPAVVGVTLNNRLIYDYNLLINQIATDFSIKDQSTYDLDTYREIAQKYVDNDIMEELEYDSDSPLIIMLFDEVDV